MSEDQQRANALAGIVMARIPSIKVKDDIECPFAKSDMTPCIVRDGATCLVDGTEKMICVGCEKTIDAIEKKCKGQ